MDEKVESLATFNSETTLADVYKHWVVRRVNIANHEEVSSASF